MKTVLVVDDDERISAAVAIRLRAAGYEAVTASDGVKGLELATEHQVSLIITDIWMNVGNGFSLAHRLRSALPRVPVLFMTASKRPGLREMAAQTGAAGFFEKPFDMQAMMAAVEICIGPGDNENGGLDSIDAPQEPAEESLTPGPSGKSESPAESPESSAADPIVPPLAESAVTRSAPPSPVEVSKGETPPPLPDPVAPKPESTPSVDSSQPSADSGPCPPPDATATEPATLPGPVSGPVTPSSDESPSPTAPVHDVPEPQASGSPALPEATAEAPASSDLAPKDDSSCLLQDPPTAPIERLPTAELVGSRRILVTDADEQAATHLGGRFRDLGHEVWVAHDPASAIDRVVEEPPDLAVIDLAMPGSSGFTLARQVRTLSSDPVAVIFTSGKKRAEYRQLAKQLGAVGLFEKPYDTEDLLRAAFEALSQPATVAP